MDKRGLLLDFESLMGSKDKSNSFPKNLVLSPKFTSPRKFSLTHTTTIHPSMLSPRSVDDNLKKELLISLPLIDVKDRVPIPKLPAPSTS